MHWLVWFASMLDGEHETRTEVVVEVCPPPEVPVWEPPQPKRQAAQSAERKGQDDDIRDFHVSTSFARRPHHLNQSPMLG